MTFKKLNCFKSYDIRSEIGRDLDSSIMYRIARAVSEHFRAKKIIIGYDSRETSPEFANALNEGVLAAGCDVFSIGMAGTEEMYCAVSEFGACAGIEVTASHNPINYNGLKIVKKKSKPLENEMDLLVIKHLAQEGSWRSQLKKGKFFDVAQEAREKYIQKVTGFIKTEHFKPIKVVVNCGNGAGGPTFDKLSQRIFGGSKDVDIVRILHEPDSSFPQGIPNPLLTKNQGITRSAIIKQKADLGVAFDGDFDRCFFFDDIGRFIPGEYLVSLMSKMFLNTNKNEFIVHDPRVIFCNQEVIKQLGGVPVISMTGHTNFKRVMRKTGAVYGGEMSAHHYFRDFAFCDSGMIPCFLILEMLSKTNLSLREIVDPYFQKFPSSGEINFKVKDPRTVIESVYNNYKRGAIIDKTDGISLTYEDWRFNIRISNTESLIRLNVESKGSQQLVSEKVNSISDLILNQKNSSDG